MISEKRLNYFEALAERTGQLEGIFVFELIDELRQMRKKVREYEEILQERGDQYVKHYSS